MPSEGARKETKYAPVQSEHLEWLTKAACRGVPMVDGISIFFPKIVKSPGRPEKGHRAHHEAPLAEFYQEAIAYCSRCPVISDCYREYTREPIPKDGMYFGKTPSQRTRINTKLSEEMLIKIREAVPFGVELDDPHTGDAGRLNDIHLILYGVVIPGYEDGFWGE